jgi:DNA-directed RNA polymerase subunit RPC12/RpoP
MDHLLCPRCRSTANWVVAILQERRFLKCAHCGQVRLMRVRPLALWSAAEPDHAAVDGAKREQTDQEIGRGDNVLSPAQ